ncbi:MAG: aconitate hydratase [Candidatus Dormiibacterota bacterium]
MPMNLAQKIISEHLVAGEMKPGSEIAITIDQTLTQDATGTMAYLQFEALDIPKVRTELSVSYVDHNMLQTSFENADDHRFLQSFGGKYGVFFSRPGNGICHQVHLERFAIPGKTLLGSDSHTPTSGGVGSLAIGAGGLDIAVAMSGQPFYTGMPKILGVRLEGQLQPWVTGKDIILEVLRRLTVRGGLGRVVEYHGPGVAHLSVPERGTVCNMGAELGATTSIFPSDEQTAWFMSAQGRGEDFVQMMADRDAEYDELEVINLDELEPLIARPHSPDNVVKVSEVEGTPCSQVAIGSCTNSSFSDLTVVANVLKGQVVHPDVSLVITPGSRQVYEMISQSGALADLITAGARILESACGPCIGMGQAPPYGGVSVRSFNRNFEGRSGTPNAQVYLTSPETCAATALTGQITDPRKLGEPVRVRMPEHYLIDDRMIIPPAENPAEVEIIRGPNIQPLPRNEHMADAISGRVLIKVGDNITTDHIMPAGAKVLPLRSNIPKISEFVFSGVDPEFVNRANKAKDEGIGGAIVGGSNYGQGSSREHAALAPMYLGVKFVLAKSFARIHRANLINFGIVPLGFVNEADYEAIAPGDELEIQGALGQLVVDSKITIQNKTHGTSFEAEHALTDRQIDIMKKGGLLNWIKEQAQGDGADGAGGVDGAGSHPVALGAGKDAPEVDAEHSTLTGGAGATGG